MNHIAFKNYAAELARTQCRDRRSFVRSFPWSKFTAKQRDALIAMIPSQYQQSFRRAGARQVLGWVRPEIIHPPKEQDDATS